MSADPDAVLPPGKLPGELLGRLLRQYIRPDPSVIIGPGIGRDAAAIEVGDRVLIVKTDPITFATADAGRYLVNVNANDIACMGGTPRWLLVTALLPERSTTPRLAESIFASLASAAGDLGITLVGGHSEITIGIDRPILVGQMLGEATRESLNDPAQARIGDAIIQAGGIAIEGTAILATEAAGALASLPAATLARAGNLLVTPGISVLPAVLALRRAGVSVRYLHDPTEGGLATALLELATATGFGIEVESERIIVLDETRAVCDMLGLDPFGLIASGALLAVVADDDAAVAVRAFEAAGVRAARVGTLRDAGGGAWLVHGGCLEPMPVFAVDEIARYFAAESESDEQGPDPA